MTPFWKLNRLSKSEAPTSAPADGRFDPSLAKWELLPYAWAPLVPCGKCGGYHHADGLCRFKTAEEALLTMDTGDSAYYDSKRGEWYVIAGSVAVTHHGNDGFLLDRPRHSRGTSTGLIVFLKALLVRVVRLSLGRRLL